MPPRIITDAHLVSKAELLRKFDEEGWSERLAQGVADGTCLRTEWEFEHKKTTIWYRGEKFKCIRLEYPTSVVIRQLLDDDGVTWAIP